MSNQKNNNQFFIVLAFLLAVLLFIWYLLKKTGTAFRTESPVMDETSKKILQDEKLTQKYFDAIEEEKQGKDATITVEGEEFRIKRVGKHSHSIATA